MQGFNAMTVSSRFSASLRSANESPPPSASKRPTTRDRSLDVLPSISLTRHTQSSGNFTQTLTKSASSLSMSGRMSVCRELGSLSDGHVESREAFRRQLIRRYGTVLGAWRELDLRRQGRISFFEFCRACQTMGHKGTVKVVWEALDSDNDGFIGFEDIDPNLAALLKEFLECLLLTAGSAEVAWQAVFHHGGKGQGRVSQKPFMEACDKLGFAGDAAAVFIALNADRLPSGVSYKDFALLDSWFRPAVPGAWGYTALRGSGGAVSPGPRIQTPSSVGGMGIAMMAAA